MPASDRGESGGSTFRCLIRWWRSRPSRLKQQRILEQSAAALLAAGFPEEVAQLVQRGKKIMAIKQYRNLNPGMGLKEAKDIIESGS